MEINLHITANSMADFRRQVKAAYEELYGAVVETPNNIMKTESKQEPVTTKETKLPVKEKSSKPAAPKTAKEVLSEGWKKRNRRYATINTPFGWNLLPTGYLEPNVKELAVIAAARELIDEIGTDALCKGLNTHVPPKKNVNGNKGWTVTRIRRILANALHSTYIDSEEADNGVFRTHLAVYRDYFMESSLRNPKKSKKKKKKTAKRSCKMCGTTKTSEWRRTLDPEGPVCNACHMREYRAAKKAKPTEAKVPEAERSKKTRDASINASLNRMKGKRKGSNNTKKKETPKIEVVPEVKIEVTTDAFLRWTKQNVPKMILRDKTFLIGTKVIQTWFTSINPSENFDSWLSDNLTVYLTHVKNIFNEFEITHPTIFLHQDAGDNSVLLVSNPRAITAAMLDKVRWGVFGNKPGSS